ncbi:MAG TPA: thiamine phosphate synthase [Vicinamibacterales bacterium]|nr:thiamine phosphate synthase [Vicinamibacterales bacterium]
MPKAPFTPTLPRLYAILDVDLTAARGLAPLDVAREWMEGGARLLQLRAKALESGPLLSLACDLVALARRFEAAVVVNDRPDIACLSGADGVHVGQDDLPPAAVRRVMPAGLLGLSTHTDDQFSAALSTPATYIAVGPVFGTATKDTGYAAVGLDFVRRSASRSDRPVVAIGGITLENAAEVIAAGAASVAVISDLLRGEPRRRAREFVARTGGLLL